MISIARSYDDWYDIYEELLDGIPAGLYYDHRGEMIPYTAGKTKLKITTDFPGSTHYLYIKREAQSSRATSTAFIPDSSPYEIEAYLEKGLNSLAVSVDKNNVASKVFSCTYFAAFLYAAAKEIYNNSAATINRIDDEVHSDESTRLMAPVSDFSKKLTYKNRLRTFGMQTIVRALVNYPGTMYALECLCKGAFVSTPGIENMEQGTVMSTAFPMYAGQEYELGKLIKLWTRNSAETRRCFANTLASNEGKSIGYSDDNTSDLEGANQFLDEDEDEPWFPDDIAEAYDTIEKDISLELPRLDRNLPIPFTTNHFWYDELREARTELDQSQSLDVASIDDPLEDGHLGKRCIPYNYDGSLATRLEKIVQVSDIANTERLCLVTMETGTSTALTAETGEVTGTEDSEGLSP